jgi:hypothetical protein
MIIESKDTYEGFTNKPKESIVKFGLNSKYEDLCKTSLNTPINELEENPYGNDLPYFASNLYGRDNDKTQNLEIFVRSLAKIIIKIRNTCVESTDHPSSSIDEYIHSICKRDEVEDIVQILKEQNIPSPDDQLKNYTRLILSAINNLPFEDLKGLLFNSITGLDFGVLISGTHYLSFPFSQIFLKEKFGLASLHAVQNNLFSEIHNYQSVIFRNLSVEETAEKYPIAFQDLKEITSSINHVEIVKKGFIAILIKTVGVKAFGIVLIGGAGLAVIGLPTYSYINGGSQSQIFKLAIESIKASNLPQEAISVSSGLVTSDQSRLMFASGIGAGAGLWSLLSQFLRKIPK